LTIIFSLSGIILIYRDTDFLKKEVQIEKTLPPGLNISQIQENLRIKNLKAQTTTGDIITFQNGTYNSTSGQVKYTSKDVAFPFNKLINFHKSISQKKTSWFNTGFGILLLFMAISSLWMLKKGSHIYLRGATIAVVGIIFAILLVCLQ